MSFYHGEPRDDREGASCAWCGEDAVGVYPIAAGSHVTDTALCGACVDDGTFPCPDCETPGLRHRTEDGVRVFSGSSLYCDGHAATYPHVVASREQDARIDERSER